jgi:hypothetical protein
VIETYKGTQIAISTTSAGDKNWTAQAEYEGPDKRKIHLEPEVTYATEEEARQAVLRAAVESIDKLRVGKGKY